METFVSRIIGIYDEARAFIKQKLEENDGNIIFLMEDEDGFYDQDLFVELPTASNVHKHGHYDEYAIVELLLVNGEVKIKMIGKGEAIDGKVETVGTEYSDSVAHIADTIVEVLS